MVKKSIVFLCQRCGYSSPKWLGKCPDCEEWNTFADESEVVYSRKGKGGSGVGGDSSSTGNNKPLLIEDIEMVHCQRTQTDIEEFDRVMGGGIVEGSLVLIGGEPGIGKSTLLMEVAGKLSNLKSDDSRVLYISGEESASQVAGRSKRLGITSNQFYIYHETIWQNMVEQIKKLRPKFIVIDSIQTTVSMDIPSAPGTISQIREVTYELMNYAKSNHITCFIIGHVTKEGSIAGPKILEHMVDVVIYFEGDQYGHYRLLRVMKNRYGNVNEVGIFEMNDKGLIPVKNPSQYFLDAEGGDAYGRSLTCIIEGSRCLFVEIQSLVVENKHGNGRRTTQGIDPNRLSMLVAVIEKYFDIPLCYYDIYINVVGGIKLMTRESDLAILASILSSLRNKSIDHKTVFIGEVGLTGEVRGIPRMDVRLKEMAQMSYRLLITASHILKNIENKFDLETIGIKKASELEYILFNREEYTATSSLSK